MIYRKAIRKLGHLPPLHLLGPRPLPVSIRILYQTMSARGTVDARAYTWTIVVTFHIWCQLALFGKLHPSCNLFRKNNQEPVGSGAKPLTISRTPLVNRQKSDQGYVILGTRATNSLDHLTLKCISVSGFIRVSKPSRPRMQPKWKRQH